MATDLPISGLPAIPSVVAGDKIEVLDVSNTTNHSTGENTFATVTQIAAAIAAINGSGGTSTPFVGAGTGHAAGLVPDPGATAHATPYILGDDGQFHPLAGTALSYSGGTYTFTAGTGGAATPGGTNGQVQVNSAGGFGGADLTALIDSAFGTTRGGILYRGAAGWASLPPGTSGQFLKSLGAGADPAYAAAPGGGSRIKQFAVTALGNLVTGTAPTSLFGGSFAVVGSRTIPANTLAQGSVITGYLTFDTKLAISDTLTLTITLGGTTILTGVSSAAAVGVVAGIAMLRFDIFFLTGGATSVCRNSGRFDASGTTSGTTACQILLSTAGGGGPSSPITIDQTAALTLDILASFSTANAGDGLRVDSGAMFIDV